MLPRCLSCRSLHQRWPRDRYRYFSINTSAETTSRTGADDRSNAIGLADMKRQVLDLAVTDTVPRFGWTKQAIVEAVVQQQHQDNSRDISLSIASLLHPNDLIRHVMTANNRRLQRDLRSKRQKQHAADGAGTSCAQGIADALQMRLEYNLRYVQSETWHEGMALGAHPDLVLETQQQLQRLIEIVLDETYTSNRQSSLLEQLSLGAVYVAAELHMLSDASAEYRDTWEFLRLRVDEWDTLRSNTASIGSFDSAGLQNSLQGTAFVASSVAMAFASGAASLLQPVLPAQPWPSATSPQHLSTSLRPDQVFWNAVFGGDDSSGVDTVDGTDPRHYSRAERTRTTSQ